MQFLMIISHDNAFVPTEALISDINAWIAEMESNGTRIHGNPLRPPADAKTVRVRKGKLALSTGPFSDAEEQMCAYELIECAHLEQAVDVASKHPMAKAATIEVRPVWTELAAPSAVSRT